MYVVISAILSCVADSSWSLASGHYTAWIV